MYYMLYDIILLESSISFPASCDLWSVSSDVICCVTAWYCHSNPNPSSKNRIKENKSKRKQVRKGNRKNVKSTFFVLNN